MCSVVYQREAWVMVATRRQLNTSYSKKIYRMDGFSVKQVTSFAHPLLMTMASNGVGRLRRCTLMEMGKSINRKSPVRRVSRLHSDGMLSTYMPVLLC